MIRTINRAAAVCRRPPGKEFKGQGVGAACEVPVELERGTGSRDRAVGGEDEIIKQPLSGLFLRDGVADDNIRRYGNKTMQSQGLMADDKKAQHQLGLVPC